MLIYYLLMVVTGTAKGGFTMATLNVTIIGLRVWSNGESIRYRLQTKEKFTAIIKQNDEYLESEVDYIDFVPSYLKACVIAHIPGADILATKKTETALKNGESNGFGAAELQVLLRNAQMVVERTKYAAGDEYVVNDEVLQHQHDGYNTEIIGIEASEKVATKLDALADAILGL